MNEEVYREVVTIDGRNLTLERPASPLAEVSAGEGGDAERLQMLDVFDPRFRPENYNKADGAPLRLFDSAPVKIDLSKRSREDMGFWHRNVDYHEVIFCIRGALRWETEIGAVELHAGEMIVIPKGITHRSMLCDDSGEENVLLELKVKEALRFVGDDK